MSKYLKTAFSFLHTYILLIFIIALPVLYQYLMKPPLFILIAGVILELVLFVSYLYNLTKINIFKKRFNEQNYERFLDKSYFMKTIKIFHKDIKGLLEDFYVQASNIISELKINSINDIVAQSLLNVVQLGENYTSLQEKIFKRMGTPKQRDEMIERNKQRLELIKSSYKELKELGGKLILMNEEGTTDEKLFLQEIKTMNEAFELHID